MKLFVLRLLFNAFENKWQMGFDQRPDVAYDASPDRWWIEFFTRNLPQSQQLVAEVLKFFPADVFSNLYRNLETYLSANENNPSSRVALATRGDQTSRAALLRGLGPEKYEAYGDGLRLILSQQIVDGLLVNNPSIEERIKNSELFSRISFWTKDAILNYPLFRGDSPLKPKAMLRMLTDGRVDDYFQEFGWFLQALAAGSINAKRDTKTQANLSDSGINRAITPSSPWSEPTIDRAFHQEIWILIDKWVKQFGRFPQVGEARPRDRSPGQFESLDHAGRQRLVAFILRRIAAADAPAKMEGSDNQPGTVIDAAAPHEKTVPPGIKLYRAGLPLDPTLLGTIAHLQDNAHVPGDWKNLLFGLQENVSQALMAAVVYLQREVPERSFSADHPSLEKYARRMQALLDAIRGSANPNLHIAVDELLPDGVDAYRLYLRMVVALRIDSLLSQTLLGPEKSIKMAIESETRSGLSSEVKARVFEEVKGENLRLFLTLAASGKIIQDLIDELRATSSD